LTLSANQQQFLTFLGVTGASAVPVAAAASPEVYRRSSVEWAGLRAGIEADLKRLEASILTWGRDQPDLDDLTPHTAPLFAVLDRLDTRLGSSLMTAAEAAEPGAQQQALAEARQAIQDYQGFVSADPLVAALDDNPFLPLTIAATVRQTLATLQARLA